MSTTLNVRIISVDLQVSPYEIPPVRVILQTRPGDGMVHTETIFSGTKDQMGEAVAIHEEWLARIEAQRNANPYLAPSSEVERLRGLIRAVVEAHDHHDHGTHPDPSPCPPGCNWPALVAEVEKP